MSDFGRMSEVMGLGTCLVLQWAELNLCDGAVSVEIYGVIKYGFKPYPESPSRVPWIWPKIIYTIIYEKEKGIERQLMSKW